MASVPSEKVADILGELAKVEDVSHFIFGVQKDPESVFKAVKTLAEQSVGNGTAASQLQNAYQRIAEKEKQLLITSNELRNARESLNNLSSSSESSKTLDKLVEVLGRLQPQTNKSAKIREGFIFNGSKKLFPTWKEGIFLKLKTNADHFPSEQSKMAFVYSMLDQDCQSHLHGSIKDGVLNFESLESMINQLTILFDDPNRVRDAIARLHSNQQRNKPFSSWIAEIRRDAAIAGYENSDKLRDIVFLNLSLELEQALIHERDIYTLDFNSAVARIQDLYNRIQSFSQKLASFKARGKRNEVTGNIYFQAKELTTTEGGDAMDLSAVKSQPRGSLSNEEKDRRRRLGLCYYCGNGKHRAINCGLKIARSVEGSRFGKEVEGNLAQVSENESAS